MLQFFSIKHSSTTISQILFVVLFILVQLAYSQKDNQDNIHFLSQDSFEELSSAYTESIKNDSLARSFAQAFLLKAKQKKDSLKQAEGYYMIAYSLTKALEYNNALPYLDSAIAYSKNNYTYEFPANAHILKANIKGAQSHFTEVMDQLILASDYAKKTNNVEQQYDIKFFIALLKNNVGEHEEGLSLLKESVAYRKKQFLKDSIYRHWYLHSMFAVVNQFNVLKQPDSALIYLKKPMALALKLKDSVAYSRMLLSTVVSHNLKSEYRFALDSLKKYDSFIRDVEVRIGTEFRVAFWYGNIYYKQGKKEIALPYLKRMDSLAFADTFFVEAMNENYVHLIDYYKGKKDTEQQLFYINRLLKVDSIFDNNGTYLSKKLYNNYDTPNLIKEKQELIKKLENKNDKNQFLLYLISFIAIVLITLLIWYYRKQRLYKKRFEELLQGDTTTNLNTQKTIELNKAEIDISEEIIQDVLVKLDKFESDLGFLKLNLTVAVLAKEFDTNSKYFSKIINAYKGKSFTTYINDLRVEHVVKELKNKPKFRKYTVKAIANEIGFNTTEAFSKSFYKTTGIYPSFFIKQLDKNIMYPIDNH